MQNFNVAPYFDDYSDDKNFYKALFVPSRPVQTRELNQIQSILQNQIKSHADHVFKNGSMVIPGHVYYDPNVYAIKLVKLYNDVSADLIVDNLVGKTMVGADTGVTALVVHYDQSTKVDQPIIYVKFISSSTTDEEVKQFKNSEVIYDKDNAATKLKLVSADSVVNASIVTVNEGIYYINGYFVRVARQTITLEKYSNKPTWRAGLEVKESIVTAVEDETLYDNALGYSNYAAPGANRYKIELILSKRSFNFDDLETTDAEGNVLEEKFVDLVQVKNGVIIQEVNATEYSEIEKIFARRTYDESGDYEVNPFNITAKEYRNNVRGAWATATPYLEGDFVQSNGLWWECLNDGVSGPTSPSETIGYKVSDGNISWIEVNPIYANMTNDGVFLPVVGETLTTHRQNADKLVYQVKPGKAYVQGFEVETKSEQLLVGRKALAFEHVEDEIIPSAAGTYAEVYNIRGLPNISTYEKVDIYYYTRAEIANFTNLRRTATTTNAEVGVITSVTITDMGYGYDKFNPPTVTVASGGGTGAILKAVISETGELKEVRIINGGTGYNGSQNVTVAAPPVTPVSIGTCRIRSMDYIDGTVGSSAAKYRLQIFDVSLMPEYNWGLHVKSILSQGAVSFAADIVEELVRLPGIVSITSGSKTITGSGTSFLSNMTEGQYIIVGGTPVYNATTGVWTSGGVRMKTSWVVPQSDDALTTPYVHPATLSGQTIDAVYSSIYSVSASLIVPFTKEFVRNVRSADDSTIDTTYVVHRHHDNLTPTTGTITITLTVDNETFAPIVSGNYIVSNKVTGAILAAPALSLNPTAKTLTITGLSADAHEVLTTIEKTSTAAREKTKSRAVKILDITDQKTLEKALIQLNEADVYRVIKVMKANGGGTGPTFAAWATAAVNGYSDITKCFILDNGQTPMFYGLGKLSKKKDCPLLNNTVRIVFEYFNHSAGDFFSVNSYVDVARDKIDTILRDALDFRPRIADDGLSFLAANGASITEPAALNSHFKVDYSYYLPRVDLITVDSKSKLDVLEGEDSFSMREPTPKANSMVIGVSRLEPGTFNVNGSSVGITKKEHKRYTMEDIGKLDRRISNLEYYSQLSLLESQTLDKNVVDQNGFDRFKAGVLVDDFNSQAVSDPGHPDFLCALDFEGGECRAFADSTSIELRETSLSATQRAASNYTITGDIISLPYEHVMCVEQPLASRTEFVNPFAVVTFNGEMTLFPSQDSWFAVDRKITVAADDRSKFNSVKALAEQQGVLGTRWNAWQTNWTGITFNMNQQNAWTRDWGNRWLDGEGFRARVTGMLQAGNIPTGNQFLTGHLGIGVTQFGERGAVGTVTAVGSRSRTGTQTTLEETRTVRFDDRILETNVDPSIRPRPVVVRATGMRPNTKVFAYFSGVDVTQYVTNIAELVVSGNITGSFDLFDDGTRDDEDNSAARKVNPNWLRISGAADYGQSKGVFWDRGDVVTMFNGVTNTGATAIVVDVIDQEVGGVSEKVVKVVGQVNSATFDWANPPSNLTGYSIRSDSGNASCNISNYRTWATGEVITNSLGAAYVVFTLPNNNNHRFTTGSISFKLTDDKTNNDALASTTSSGSYVASGIIQKVDTTQTTVIGANLVNRNVAVNENINQTLFIGGRGDPLAQTFSISESGGAFITKAEVYFAVKDASLPVRCEIRNVVNGYPGPDVIARKSLNPSQITVNEVALTPTEFVFAQPVYLQPGIEYCMVLLSDSNVYKVWIARMGEQIIGTNKLITTQPSLGSLFKSQNNSTWTAEQYEDLTFKLYKAKFDISKRAIVEFVNKRLPTTSLSDNAFYALSGSNIVRVYHSNHGFVEGDTVVLNGVEVGTSGPFAALATTYLAGNNFEDEAQYIVSNVEYDFYTITIVDALGAAVNAAYTSQFGGRSAEATFQVMYSTMMPNIQVQSFPETTASLTSQSMKGDPVNAYNFLAETATLNRENSHFTSIMLVASHDNEAKRIAKDKSVKLKMYLDSTDENLSPVINAERASMICVRNKINNPTLESVNYTAFDDITLCTNKTVSFLHVHNAEDLICASYFETTDSTLFDDFDKITTGKYITATSGINNGFTFRVLKKMRLMVGATDTYRVYVSGAEAFVDGTDTTACTLVLHNRYVDELAPFGTSVLATYVSQAMRTAVPSTGVRITLDANIPTGTMIEVYHRHMVANSLVPLHEQCWHPIESLRTITTTADFNTFTEYVFEGLNMSAHDIGQLKIVFRSDNPALTPRVSALRMIALA